MQDPVQKKIFALFILIVCGFVLYWISEFVFPPTDPLSSLEPITTRTNSNPLFEGDSLNAPLASISTMSNLTNGVIVDASKELISSLQITTSTSKEDLLEALKNATTSPISESLLQKYMSPDQIGLVTTVSDSDVSLIKDSPAALSTYAVGYRDILLSISDIDISKLSSTLNSFMIKKDASDLDSVVQKYENIYSALRQLQVPQSRAVFHKNNLIYFGSMVSVLKSIRLYDTDPVRAYIAAQYFPQVVAQWGPISQDIIKYN